MANNPVPPIEIPPNLYERRSWLRHQLLIRGLKLSDIAAEEGVSGAAMSRLFLYPNIHLETAIAKKLGVTAAQLFPERFDAAGQGLRIIREQSRSTAAQRRERTKTRA